MALDNSMHSEGFSEHPSDIIAWETMDAIRAGPVPYHFASGISDRMISKIKEQKLSDADAHSTFDLLRLLIENENLPEIPATPGLNNRDLLELAKGHLEFKAVSYFLEILTEIYKEMDLPAIKRDCTAKLREMDDIWQRYIKMALQKVKANAEQRIEEARIEIEDRRALGMTETDEPGPTSSNSKRKGESLTAIERVIAYQYFLKHFGVYDSIPRQQLANFLTALNDGKDKKNHYDHLGKDDWYLHKHGDSGRKIVAMFYENGLEQVARVIENDLNGWKPKNH